MKKKPLIVAAERFQSLVHFIKAAYIDLHGNLYMCLTCSKQIFSYITFQSCQYTLQYPSTRKTEYQLHMNIYTAFFPKKTGFCLCITRF